jgi:Phosphopantetheine attachment site/AMP-binding enzyme
VNQFRGEGREQMYKTGDLGRWLPDGSIAYLGRNDHQVKLRGFRIELGEIEARLMQYEGVREAVVLAREDRAGDKRLIAYYTAQALDPVAADTASPSEAEQVWQSSHVWGPLDVPESGGTIGLDSDVARDGHDTSRMKRTIAFGLQLRAYLSATLPEYMVPADYVRLDKLPLTSNGKLDRRALPAPERDGKGGDYVEPATPTQRTLAAIWSQLLGVERVGVNDNFFELGGHSLLATQATSKVRAVFNVELPLRILLDTANVMAVAHYIDTAYAAQQQAKAQKESSLIALKSKIDNMSPEEIAALLVEKKRARAQASQKGKNHE